MAKKGTHRQAVKRHVRTHVRGSTVKRKLSKKELGKRSAPLARVLSAFVASKTTRDDPAMMAKDLSTLVEARDPKSRLGKALAELEKHVAKTKAGPKRRAKRK